MPGNDVHSLEIPVKNKEDIYVKFPDLDQNYRGLWQITNFSGGSLTRGGVKYGGYDLIQTTYGSNCGLGDEKLRVHFASQRFRHAHRDAK